MFNVRLMPTITGRMGIATPQLPNERGIRKMNIEIVLIGITAIATSIYAFLEIIKRIEYMKPFIAAYTIDGSAADSFYDGTDEYVGIQLYFYPAHNAIKYFSIKCSTSALVRAKHYGTSAGQHFSTAIIKPDHDPAPSLDIDFSLPPKQISDGYKFFTFFVCKKSIDDTTRFHVSFKREHTLFKKTQNISEKITHIIKQNTRTASQKLHSSK